MDRQLLEALLADGHSLEEVGRRVGRHPSTVSYWLEKYGLRATGSERHRSRGSLDRESLHALVAEGRTVAEIARVVDRSVTTVRYWLRFHGLETRRSARLRAGGRPSAATPAVADIACSVHGLTTHTVRGGRYRCRRCNSEAVTRFRRSVKRRLVDEAGGCCVICGYSRSMVALQFHHVDPSTKRFNLGMKGISRSLETVRAEAAKCVLLCANCHAEVEAGISILPDAAGSDRG